jgi:hypothetical protein
MKFKVGDIIRFKRGDGRTSIFKAFMYNGDHIITQVKEELIKTEGNGWCYTERDCAFPELSTSKVHWEYIELVNTNSWKGSILKFNFINNDL